MELSTKDSNVFHVQGDVNEAVWFTGRVWCSFCVMEISHVLLG